MSIRNDRDPVYERERHSRRMKLRGEIDQQQSTAAMGWLAVVILATIAAFLGAFL